jgi:hypothetical protein
LALSYYLQRVNLNRPILGSRPATHIQVDGPGADCAEFPRAAQSNHRVDPENQDLGAVSDAKATPEGQFGV